MNSRKIVEDWSGRLEAAHRMQDEAKARGEVPGEVVLPSGLPACPVATTIAMVGNRWRPQILRELLSGTKRFGELQCALGGVSQKVLTSNLRELEEVGVLTRTAYPEVPPRVEYALTELGFTLEPVIDAMWRWGVAYQESRS